MLLSCASDWIALNKLFSHVFKMMTKICLPKCGNNFVNTARLDSDWVVGTSSSSELVALSGEIIREVSSGFSDCKGDVLSALMLSKFTTFPLTENFN